MILRCDFKDLLNMSGIVENLLRIFSFARYELEVYTELITQNHNMR